MEQAGGGARRGPGDRGPPSQHLATATALSLPPPQPTEFHVVPKTSQEVGATETQISRNRGPRREPANWVCQGTVGEGSVGTPGRARPPRTSWLAEVRG